MDSIDTFSVNSTLGCYYNVSSPTQSSARHCIDSHDGTTDERRSGDDDETCCRSWSSLLLFVLVAAGVTGNTLVCGAVAVERKLRNVTNYFLVSLAVADLLVSVVVMPSCIAHDVIGKY